MGLLVLPGHVVDQVVSKFTPDELMNLMARVFMDLHASYEAQETASNDVIIPHRSTVSSHNHHALFMPSRLAPLAGTAIKIVSVPTAQASASVKANGLPASTVVLDEQTGEVAAVVNARKLTPLRNAASKFAAIPGKPNLLIPSTRRLVACQQHSRCKPTAERRGRRSGRADCRTPRAVSLSIPIDQVV